MRRLEEGQREGFATKRTSRTTSVRVKAAVLHDLSSVRGQPHHTPWLAIQPISARLAFFYLDRGDTNEPGGPKPHSSNSKGVGLRTESDQVEVDGRVGIARSKSHQACTLLVAHTRCTRKTRKLGV